MAKASIVLPNGTNVVVEGTTEEIQKLLSFYGADSMKQPQSGSAKHSEKKKTKDTKATVLSANAEPDLSEIISLVKNSDDSEAVGKQILDRTSSVDRTLLPLYVVHEYLGNSFGLTSGEINKILTDLGVPISMPNIAHTLSGAGSRYVVGDKVRVKGIPVRYKLSRKGVQYLKSVLTGKSDGK